MRCGAGTIPGMRRTAVLLVLSALLGALVVLGAASPAQACECAGFTTAEYTAGADAVFTGRLVSREEPAAPVTSSADLALHVFAVDAVAKGAVAERQEVLSPWSGASCGLELTGEGPVVVFATRTPDSYLGSAAIELGDGQYYAYLCGGTAPLTPQLAAELGTLRPVAATATAPSPVAPVEPQAAATPAPDRGGPPVALLGAGAAVLAAAGALLLRRRRSR